MARWLFDYSPPQTWEWDAGYILVRDGWFWTGDRERPWSRNATNALVDQVAPWPLYGLPGLPAPDAENRMALLGPDGRVWPLHRWPR